MAKVPEVYWVVRLYQQVKSAIHHCHLDKKYHRKPLEKAVTIMLPTFCKTPLRAFENSRVDFAGPLQYKIAKRELGKAYVALYTCAASREV